MPRFRSVDIVLDPTPQAPAAWIQAERGSGREYANGELQRLDLQTGRLDRVRQLEHLFVSGRTEETGPVQWLAIQDPHGDPKTGDHLVQRWQWDTAEHCFIKSPPFRWAGPYYFSAAFLSVDEVVTLESQSKSGSQLVYRNLKTGAVASTRISKTEWIYPDPVNRQILIFETNPNAPLAKRYSLLAYRCPETDRDSGWTLHWKCPIGIGAVYFGVPKSSRLWIPMPAAANQGVSTIGCIDLGSGEITEEVPLPLAAGDLVTGAFQADARVQVDIRSGFNTRSIVQFSDDPGNWYETGSRTILFSMADRVFGVERKPGAPNGFTYFSSDRSGATVHWKRTIANSRPLYQKPSDGFMIPTQQDGWTIEKLDLDTGQTIRSFAPFKFHGRIFMGLVVASLLWLVIDLTWANWLGRLPVPLLMLFVSAPLGLLVVRLFTVGRLDNTFRIEYAICEGLSAAIFAVACLWAVLGRGRLIVRALPAIAVLCITLGALIVCLGSAPKLVWEAIGYVLAPGLAASVVWIAMRIAGRRLLKKAGAVELHLVESEEKGDSVDANITIRDMILLTLTIGILFAVARPVLESVGSLANIRGAWIWFLAAAGGFALVSWTSLLRVSWPAWILLAVGFVASGSLGLQAFENFRRGDHITWDVDTMRIGAVTSFLLASLWIVAILRSGSWRIDQPRSAN
ncbi:MAG: hypothetical protein AAF958_11920 [Planctomycetota bacterium]